jgi:hypothetical protein
VAERELGKGDGVKVEVAALEIVRRQRPRDRAGVGAHPIGVVPPADAEHAVAASVREARDQLGQPVEHAAENQAGERGRCL